MRPSIRCFLLTFMLCAVTLPVQGIMPDWDDSELEYPPFSRFFNRRTNAVPVVYRTEISISRSVSYAVVKVSADRYWHGYVNGTYLPDSRNTIDSDEPFLVDLTPYLKRGTNVFVCSASTSGFVLSGYAVYTNGVKKKLSTGTAGWKVKQYPPLTVLAREECMQPGYDMSGWDPVKSSRAIKSTKSTMGELFNHYILGESKRLRKRLDDAYWRAELLAKKGITVIDWEAFGFGGSGRLQEWLIPAARKIMGRKDALQKRLDDLDAVKAGLKSTGSREGQRFLQTRKLIRGYEKDIETISLWVRVNDERDSLVMHWQYFHDSGHRAAAILHGVIRSSEKVLKEAGTRIYEGTMSLSLGALKKALASIEDAKKKAGEAWGHRMNDLNTTIYNPFGWFDNNDLFGNDIGEWGIRVNPVDISWTMNLDGKWRFRVDPKNIGLKETRHQLDYNIENQWRQLSVPGAWEKQGITQQNPNTPDDTPYPGVNVRIDGQYNGYAWYRKTLRIPAEWAGYDLELYVSKIDDWDWTYFNGLEIGHTGANDENWWRIPRVYKIPKDTVNFGGFNAITFRIYDCGAGGFLGSVELRCPALKEAYENKPKKKYTPASLFASPFSPGIMLRTGGRSLDIWGWEQRSASGPQGIILPLSGSVKYVPFDESGTVYDRKTDGKLAENWVMLWNDVAEGSTELPVQLVMEKAPLSISVEKGKLGVSSLSVKFSRPEATVFMVRPVKAEQSMGTKVPEAVLDRARYWSRTLLAYPLNYIEIARKVPGRKKAVDIVDIYQYRVIKDDFGTKPAYHAPLPPFAGFAQDTGFPGVRIPGDVRELGYTLGEWGELKGIQDAKQISYRVPFINERKRQIGFSHWCFVKESVGVPDNIPEIELIASVGANTFRPQHNFSDESAEQLVKWCVERNMNHTFNCDGRYGNEPGIVKHYAKLAKMCAEYPADLVSYDLINEPAVIPLKEYNPKIKKITKAIRKEDRTHLIYVETPASFASVDEFVHLEPTGDGLTYYSFHDYNFRLPPYWPNTDVDMRTALRQFLPAFRFMLVNHVPLHLGEYGAHEQTRNDPFTNPCAVTIMLDFLKMLDQFGMPSHYYSNRDINRLKSDGSLYESLVQEGFRRYFARGTAHCYFDE